MTLTQSTDSLIPPVKKGGRGDLHSASFVQYLEWEPRQPERHELVDGEVFAMTGARDGHNRIAGNVFVQLRLALKDSPCRSFMSDMKLYAESVESCFYPDVFVTCDARDRAAGADLFKQHPSLIIEVLSESTAAYDRGRKFEIYRSLPSLREVMFVEQDRMQVDLFRRNADDRWELFPASADGALRLNSVDMTLTLSQIHEDVLPRLDDPAPGDIAVA